MAGTVYCCASISSWFLWELEMQFAMCGVALIKWRRDAYKVSQFQTPVSKVPEELQRERAFLCGKHLAVYAVLDWWSFFQMPGLGVSWTLQTGFLYLGT